MGSIPQKRFHRTVWGCFFCLTILFVLVHLTTAIAAKAKKRTSKVINGAGSKVSPNNKFSKSKADISGEPQPKSSKSVATKGGNSEAEQLNKIKKALTTIRKVASRIRKMIINMEADPETCNVPITEQEAEPGEESKAESREENKAESREENKAESEEKPESEEHS